MKIELTEPQKELLSRKIVSIYLDDFDEEISPFRAERILDAFTEQLAPVIYNLALEDVKQYLLQQIDDLDAIFHKA